MRISVIITSRNRVDDLANTLRSLSALSPSPDEIIVTLDGCADGSAELLRNEFPEVRAIVNPVSRGSIPSRDRMLREATGELALSLDDDSHPLDADFLPRAARLFVEEPRLALAAFPQRSEEFPDSLTRSDFGADARIGSYASSGVMIRIEAYRSLSGYATLFGHAYEEPDFTLQCIAAGWSTRFHTGLLIRHHYSGANRNEVRIHHLHARNEFWSVLMRCPSPWWPLVALKRAAGQFAYACNRGPRWIVREPVWWWRALGGAPRAWSLRQPVTWAAYRKWRILLRNPQPLESK